MSLLYALQSHVLYSSNTCSGLAWCTGQHADNIIVILHLYTTVAYSEHVVQLCGLHEYCHDLVIMQACTEMVMPMCSDGQHDMFMNNTWNLTAYQDNCFKQFGVRPDPYWMETAYGGKNIEAHSNIVFRCKFHRVE